MKNDENPKVENENPASSMPENKNKHKKIWIAIGIVFIILIIGIIVFAKLNGDNCTNNTLLKPTSSGTSSEPSGEVVDEKPIIYLYPEHELEISLKLGKPENITCSYPKYQNSWNVLAKPNGDLKDLTTNKQLYSLYYESKNEEDFKIEDDGFVVKGEDSAEFLEEKLSILGLTERESEEFIVYWLPRLESSKYNYIRFATLEEINKNMPLEINPNPDTIIRVLMTFKGLEKPIDVKEQQLQTPDRTGFVAVEWGGTEIK